MSTVVIRNNSIGVTQRAFSMDHISPYGAPSPGCLRCAANEGPEAFAATSLGTMPIHLVGYTATVALLLALRPTAA
ncbi:MAG: hypothetical protein IH602_10840 [Bryobacteraceae bacterium]|nr:hypothetical protein [Bryobacteraceae bacterium]